MMALSKKRMTKKWLRDIEAMDLRHAAVHEAGHLTVAISQCLPCRAWLMRRDDVRRSNALDLRIWAGTAQLVGALMRPEISVAGMVAEWIDDNPGQADCVCDMMEIIDMSIDEVSPTDAAGFPKDRRALVRAFRKAERLLLKHDGFFRWSIDQLIEHKTITDYQAGEQFKAMS